MPRVILAATCVALSCFTAVPVTAATPQGLLDALQRESAPGDPARGARFFTSRHGGEWSCASCHTEKPVQPGRHAKTDKPIQPLAPAANAERFTDAAKVDKWFRRNCNDVLNRACSPQEKADVLAWLLAQK